MTAKCSSPRSASDRATGARRPQGARRQCRGAPPSGPRARGHALAQGLHAAEPGTRANRVVAELGGPLGAQRSRPRAFPASASAAESVSTAVARGRRAQPGGARVHRHPRHGPTGTAPRVPRRGACTTRSWTSRFARRPVRRRPARPYAKPTRSTRRRSELHRAIDGEEPLRQALAAVTRPGKGPTRSRPKNCGGGA